MALYFAYGSNLLGDRLRHSSRAPRARRHAVARLEGYALRFHKRGRDGSGKCDAWRAEDERAALWGVVWEVAEADLDRLDRVEGDGYRRVELSVRSGDGRNGSLRIQTYLARRSWIDPTLRPFDWYRELVIAGAVENGLPQRWLRAVEAVGADRDPDSERRARFRALLGRAD